MKIGLTSRARQRVLTAAAALLVLGFACQVFALDRFVDPVGAAGSPSHEGTQYCHGSLSNCAGTVDVGSSLQAKLAPPIPPSTLPGELDLAVKTPDGVTPVLTDPPPRLV